jgi:hypothetical protein
MPPHRYCPVAPVAAASASGNVRDGPNAGAAARPRLPTTLPPSLSSTVTWLGGTTQRMGAITPAAGGGG